MAAPVPKRRFMWGETAFLMAWIAARWPTARVHLNMRLGSLDQHVPRANLNPAQRALMGAFNRYADAVIETPPGVTLVEAKIRKQMGGIGELLAYRERVADTEDLGNLRRGPVTLVLLVPAADPEVAAVCARSGIRYEVFLWTDLDAYISERERDFRNQPKSDVTQVF